jgi:hypothetical protein
MFIKSCATAILYFYHIDFWPWGSEEGVGLMSLVDFYETGKQLFLKIYIFSLQIKLKKEMIECITT